MEKKDMQKKPHEDIQEDKIFALIAYLFILCIIPLLLKKENKFVLFHAKQGLVLFIGEVAVFIVRVVPFLGPLIWNLGFLIFGFISLFGITQALMGKYTKIPVVSTIAEKIIL